MKKLTDLLSGIKYSSASDISEMTVSDIVYNSKKFINFSTNITSFVL